MIRYEVTYSGRVQGVGFRATTRTIARDFEISGWVRNDPDGTVSLVAEGRRSEVDGFLAEVRQRLSRFIDQATVTEGPPRGSYASFEVRY